LPKKNKTNGGFVYFVSILVNPMIMKPI